MIRKEGKKADRIEASFVLGDSNFSPSFFLTRREFFFPLSLRKNARHPFSRVEELFSKKSSHPRDIHQIHFVERLEKADPTRPKILHAGIDNPRRLLHRSRDSSARERGKRPSANACLRIRTTSVVVEIR